MQINGNNFKIYISDTVNSIKDRIAVSMNTLPQYLVFNPELTSSTQGGDIHVFNVLTPILNSTESKFPEDLVNFDKISREEAERIFIATHDLNNAEDGAIDLLLGFVITGITTLSPVAVWKDRVNIRNKMKEQIDKLRKDVETTTVYFEEFENIPSIHTVEYEVSMVQFTIHFKINPYNAITVPELFNSLTVSKLAPYANMGSFYKVFHDFIPNNDWLDLETPNVILVKVNGEVTGDLRTLKNQYKKYTDAAFTILNGNIIATCVMNVGHRNVSRDVFINRVLQVFPLLDERMIKHVDELSTGGYITYPNQTVLIPIWSEFCMNDPFFNRIVSLDESIRASKIKLNAYMHVIGNDDILSFTMKETDKPNMYGMEDEGSNYIRVRVKATTVADSLKYQKILGRLFTLYNNKRDIVLAEYRNYLGTNFLQDEQTKLITRPRKIEKLELRSIAPDIFLPTYSRKCLKRPTIITKDQAAYYRRNNEKQVMEFPAHGESIKRYYICEHTTHPYPGLRDNTLDNKRKFPYIPCCYTKNQDREGTKFKYYFTQGILKQKHSAIQDIFITGKIMPPGLPGMLPPNLRELFSLIEPNPEFQFIRIGSNMTKSSFLECVMLALNIENMQFIKVEDRIPIVERMRRRIVTETNAMAAKQEFYDEPMAIIMDKFANSSLNALEFGHVLELVFKCNIFVLSASSKDPDGTMIIPRHAQAYYKLQPNSATIFIYQYETHTESDIEIQCELITSTKADEIKVLNNMNTSFPACDKSVLKMWEIFRQINRSFNHNTMLPSIYIRKLNVKAQIIDIYGKCRVVNIDFNGHLITMVSEPIPPYNADKATQVYRTSIDVLKAFSQKMGVVFIKQRVKNNHVREVQATMSKGALNVTFLCDDINKLDGVIITEEPEEYSELLKPTENITSKFSHHKKIAKIIYQYALYFLSQFMHKNNITIPLNEQQLIQFSNEHIVTRPEHIFKSIGISPKFSLDSQFVYNKTKVIMTSREMIVRIMYMLRLYMNTHLQELVSYTNKIYIENFYDEISDFDEIPSQFILEGKTAVTGLIESYKTSNKVSKSLMINNTEPYFMYNTKIGNKIYLAQNVEPIYEHDKDSNNVIVKSKLQTATDLVRFWDKHGYNAYRDPILSKFTDTVPVDVYSYISTDEIYNLTNYTVHASGLILGYLVNGNPVYTALMPI